MVLPPSHLPACYAQECLCSGSSMLCKQIFSYSGMQSEEILKVLLRECGSCATAVSAVC